MVGHFQFIHYNKLIILQNLMSFSNSTAGQLRMCIFSEGKHSLTCKSHDTLEKHFLKIIIILDR